MVRLTISLFFLCIINTAFSQIESRVSYQGFIEGAFLFLVKHCGEDTIQVKSLIYFAEYNKKCKCFHVHDKFYTIKNGVVFFKFPYFTNKASMYMTNVSDDNAFIVDNIDRILFPQQSFGMRLYPKGIKKRKLRNFQVGLEYEGKKNDGNLVKFIYPPFDCSLQ